MAFDELSLNTPSKRVKIEPLSFGDVKHVKPVVEETQEAVEDLDALRQRWVGEVDLPERESRVAYLFSSRL